MNEHTGPWIGVDISKRKLDMALLHQQGKSTSVEHRCAHCGSGKIQLKHVTRSFGKGANLLVIEGVPLWSCPSCGESYFTAKTMHEIERIKALRKSVAIKRPVSVASFEATDA